MIESLKTLLHHSPADALYYQLALLNSVNDAIASTDQNFIIKTWNAAAERIHGYTVAEAVGKDVRSLLNYDYIDDNRETAMATLRTEGQWRGIVRFNRPDGQVFYLQSSLSLVRNNEDDMLGFVGINRDITQDYNNRQSLHDFISILSEMEENFFVVDRCFRLSYLSENAVTNSLLHFGMKFSEGQDFLSQFPELYREDLRKMLSSASEGTKISRTISMMGQEGMRWGYLQALPIRNHQGSVHSVCLVIRDTTEQVLQKKEAAKKRDAEEQLFQSRQMFEAFMHNAPLISWITREDGKMEYMNPLYYKALNFTKNEIGKSIFDIFPKDIADSYYANNMEVLKNGVAVEAIEKVHYPNGEIGTLKIYKFPLQIGGKRMVGGWAVDITALVNMQEKLTASNERYEYVNRATSDAIYDWDLLTKKIYRGNGFKVLFGFESITTSIRFRFSRIHPDDYERVKKEYFTALREMKDSWQIEYRFRDINDVYHHVLDKAFILSNGNRVVRVIGAFQDITQQIQVQQQLTEKEKARKQEVVTSIIETQENERRQLSVLLRDSINQTLTSTKLMLDMAVSSEDMAPKFAEKGRESISKAIAEVNKLSRELNPSAVDDMDLIEGLNELLPGYQAMFPVELTIKNKNLLASLPNGKQLAVYRILQDYLELYLRHGGKGKLSISLTGKSGGCELILKHPATEKELMCKNIEHRIEYLQGTLEIKVKRKNVETQISFLA